jgi:hypothetical protein
LSLLLGGCGAEEGGEGEEGGELHFLALDRLTLSIEVGCVGVGGD